MADCNGEPLRRLLASAECFSDAAIRFGSDQVNTPRSRSSELLVVVTRCDQRRFEGVAIRVSSVNPGAICGPSGPPLSRLEHAAVDEMIRNKTADVGEKTHVAELDGGPSPAAGFAAHHRDGRHALHRERKKDQQRYG